MAGRRRGSLVLCWLLAAAAAIGAFAPAPARGLTGPLTTFPQGIAPNFGSGLLQVGHRVYYEMVDENGDTTIGRIGPGGHADTATTPGSGYVFNAPTRTSDGGIWLAVDMGGAAAAAPGDTPNLGVAGLDPATWQVDALPTLAFTLDGWQSIADRGGRFWTQGNVPATGLMAVGAGLHAPLVGVTTHIGPLSSESDITINNPMVLGPDGRVWMLGGDGFGAGLRITSVGPAGIGVDVAPALLRVGALALTPARGGLWTVGVNRLGRLVAFVVDPTGATARVRTGLRGECDLGAVQPVADGHGRLWFTAADAACSPSADLMLAAVDMKHHESRARATGLTVLDAVSSVVPARTGVIVAGLDADGNLGFARVARRSQLFATALQPWVAPSQARYPLVGDRRAGAWAQAVDADGNLAVVHVTRTGVVTTATGIGPVAREMAVGPDGALWTQGVKDGQLVLVRVRPNGRMTLYPTGEAPTQMVLKPAADGRGRMWFRATDPTTGELVLVRVAAGRA
jgi:hypothetical protein